MSDVPEKDYYGIYTQPREAVWRAAKEFDVCAFPVSVTQIARSMNTALIPYSDRLPPPIAGLSGHAELVRGKWYVFFEPSSVVSGHARITIAHELGHILMGHRMKNGLFINSPAEELEAMQFAERLIAPACVLWALGMYTPESISTGAGIAYQDAIYRARRVREIHDNDKYLRDECEQKIFAQFMPYIIQEYKRQNKPLPEYILKRLPKEDVSGAAPKGI